MTTWTHFIDVIKEEDGIFMATSPSLRSAMTFGHTAQSASDRMKTLLDGYYRVLATGEAEGEFHILEVDIPYPLPEATTSRSARFIIHLEEDEDVGGYCGTSMQVGCASQGNSIEEALAMMHDMIEVELEMKSEEGTIYSQDIPSHGGN